MGEVPTSPAREGERRGRAVNIPANNAPVRDWALYYRSLGLHPLPVIPGEKSPPFRWKEYQTRQPTAEEIERWDWSGGVGITTNGLICVDCDAGGEQLIRPREFPISWTVRTGSGGLHRYFKSTGGPGRNKVRLLTGENGAGIDIRADGGFIILPPTRHKVTGEPYQWLLPPWYHSLEPAPQWIIEAIGNGSTSSQSDNSGGDVIPQGKRNATLASLAGTMRRRGMQEQAILAALLETNARQCDPALPESEVRAIASSIGGYQPATPKERKPRAPSVDLLSDIAPEAVTWVWPGRIPGGKVSLLIGDPGLGKSLTCLDLAARITTGGLWPDGTRAPEGNVVLLTAEDGLADTVRPRLDALGGKPEHVYVLRAIREGDTERSFDLTSDLAHLETLMTRVNAVAAFLDPISAYLGKTDSYRDSEVRGVLAPLAAVAERTGSGVVGVMHLTKNQQRQLIHRVQGNIAFAAAARAVFAIAEDRDVQGRRYFAPVKMNLARKPMTLAFQLEEAGGVPVVKWEVMPVEVDAESLLGPPESEETRGAHDQAKDFLRETLADGPVEAVTVKAAAKRERIKHVTLFKAKASLGIVSRKGGYQGSWVWEMPKGIERKGA